MLICDNLEFVMMIWVFEWVCVVGVHEELDNQAWVVSGALVVKFVEFWGSSIGFWIEPRVVRVWGVPWKVLRRDSRLVVGGKSM